MFFSQDNLLKEFELSRPKRKTLSCITNIKRSKNEIEFKKLKENEYLDVSIFEKKCEINFLGRTPPPSLFGIDFFFEVRDEEIRCGNIRKLTGRK